MRGLFRTRASLDECSRGDDRKDACRSASRLIANRPTDHARPGRASRSNRACLPARAGQHAHVTGRSSDSQARRAACLLGSVRPKAKEPNGSMQPSFVSRKPWAKARKASMKTPGHSGGAVPESHRSSLFAGGKQQQSSGHQRHWVNVGIRTTLSRTPSPALLSRRVSQPRSTAGKL